MDSHQPGHPAKEHLDGAVLVIRADANTAIGSGHVMRCLALAQAWQDQGGAVAFVSEVSAPLWKRLEAEGIEIHSVAAELGSMHDAEQLIEATRQLGARHVVVDGYHFGAAYQKRLKDARLRVLFVDDNGHAEHYSADVVLNQNIHASQSLYPRREPYTRLLLGSRYALLRREFQPWREWRRAIPGVARKVLVTMGGSDPDNVTLKVLRALEQVQLPDLEARVVVGGSNPHFAELERAAQHSPHTVRLERNVGDMPALMAWADVAVSAGGSTCWELAFMGLPSIVLVLADNQRMATEHLAQQDVVVNLGPFADLWVEAISEAIFRLLEDRGRRKHMSEAGWTLVDARGAERVATVLSDDSLVFRAVSLEDQQLLWQWANDPIVRRFSFAKEPVPLSEHVPWFSRVLSNPNEKIFIFENLNGTPVGQVRFRIQGCEAVVSITVASEFRGQGYGGNMLQAALNELFRQQDVHVVHAYVLPENTASRKLFLRAGFRISGEVVFGNTTALDLVITRPEFKESSEDD